MTLESSGDAVPVTPANGAAGALGFTSRQIRAETAGTITGLMASGNQRTCYFKDGESRQLRFTHIYSTNTSCTGIEAMR